jgi:hypothetical protein
VPTLWPDYKPTTIVNEDSRVINKLKTSLTDDARAVICDYHMFIVQTTGFPIVICWQKYLVESQVLEDEVLLALNALRRGWSGTQSQGLSYSMGFTADRNASMLVGAVVTVPGFPVDGAAAAALAVVGVGVAVEKMLDVVEDDDVASDDDVKKLGGGDAAGKTLVGVADSAAASMRTSWRGWFSGTGGSGLVDIPCADV